MVESWRQVAKAAAMGEHDLGGPLNHGRLSAQECMTVLSDAAEVTRALVVLDKRYANIPGWQEIRERGRLDHAARSVFLVRRLRRSRTTPWTCAAGGLRPR